MNKIVQLFKKEKEVEIKVESKERENILDILYAADKVYMSEYTVHKPIKPIDYTDIYNTVLWLEKELKLNEIEHEIMHSFHKEGFLIEHSYLSPRQYSCFHISLINIKDNMFGSAFHEICDFIHNYKINISEPISTIEKVLLSIWVKVFKTAYDKAHHVNYEI